MGERYSGRVEVSGSIPLASTKILKAITAHSAHSAHSAHKDLSLGSGDILFHCGDFTKKGHLTEVLDFASYIEKQDYKHKVEIAGNHDFFFENNDRFEAEKIFNEHGIVYLNDSYVILEDMKIWGCPVQPWFYDWAFNRKRGMEIKKHRDLIPDDINILLTHGPPHGILDRTHCGEYVGCEELLKIVARINPHIHVFGDIHEV